MSNYPPTKVADLLPGDVVRLLGGRWDGLVDPSRTFTVGTVEAPPYSSEPYATLIDGAAFCDDGQWPFEFVSRPGVTLTEAPAIVYLHHEPIETFRGEVHPEAIKEALERAVSAVKRTQREWPWGKRLGHVVNDGTLSVFWEDM